ncbi:aspartate aminotransferase family protein [Crenobacter cavernae]|uniref:Aminotransferase class III-fold pyridoxal phosphate-dependent enzyme n=1 Tax=Crenobacter cavernae TaxID=2290923 RepID=A0ABY0FIP5_9NEIS|nr:aminotransferase class III-fold pyridoxal phosphate-dependent enzyme [Crenobacter cavernae]RXZ45618.1 aminotransferase class III-fold pyridoxal phosphate-dependent enzyme [Crenobacter cavernae]
MTTNAKLDAYRTDAVSRGIKVLHPVYLDRAENAEVWDTEGKRYIDFVGGIGVLNTGHRHTKVMKAVAAQLERYTHSCFNALPHEPYLSVASELNRRCPVAGEARTMLTNSGAEAMENAIKLARAFTGRTALIAFDGGFHGRTLATLALTAKVAPYKKGLGPLPGPVFHVPYASRDNGVSAKASLAAIERLFKVEVDPADVAAIVIEPVQGEGGFLVADFEFLKALRALCDKHGIVLIADEIQSGFGRSGRFFAIEHSGVKPDVVVMGKSLAGGFPLAALTGRVDVMDALAPGGLGGTYAGNPVACAAAGAVFDVIDSERLLARGAELGALIERHVPRLKAGPHGASIGRVNGVGGMRAFEIVDDGKPAPQKLQALIAAARRLGLLLMAAGEHGNVVRLLPPLTIPFDQLDEGFALIDAALAEVAV